MRYVEGTMQLSGNWLVAERLVTTALYKLLRLVFIVVQRLYWQLNGTAEKLREARLPQNYDRSAQVLDVVLFHKFCTLQTTTVDNFLCTHNRFENPQYIIDNDNITLMTINEHEAVFCETKEKGMHLWRSEYSSLITFAQMKFCRRLIVVPLSTFHRMAEVIGDPSGELIFLFTSGRCGSSLLTQVMEFSGRCVAISEPNSSAIIAKKYREFGDSPELRHLARDAIRWECRPYPTMMPPPLGYFVKIRPSQSVALPLLRDMFPSSRYLFMYRDFVTVAKSFYRMEMVMPSQRLRYLFGFLSIRFTEMTSLDNSNRLCKRLDSALTVGVLLSALVTSIYMDLRRRGWDVRAVRYEDLVARPLDMCRVVLEFCQLPVSLAELAVRAVDVDSHRNTEIARRVIGQISEPQLTPQRKAKLDEHLKNYGMPCIGEPLIVEGTLSG